MKTIGALTYAAALALLISSAASAQTNELFWTNTDDDRIDGADKDGSNAGTVVGLDATFGSANYLPFGITNNGTLRPRAKKELPTTPSSMASS